MIYNRLKTAIICLTDPYPHRITLAPQAYPIPAAIMETTVPGFNKLRSCAKWSNKIWSI